MLERSQSARGARRGSIHRLLAGLRSRTPEEPPLSSRIWKSGCTDYQTRNGSRFSELRILGIPGYAPVRSLTRIGRATWPAVSKSGEVIKQIVRVKRMSALDIHGGGRPTVTND